jgi:hypothetical protein
MKEVKYNKEFISLLNNLSIINKKFIINKKDNKIRVDGKNEGVTVAYTFNCDAENFDFDGEEIAFYNFSEFYDLFNVYKDSSLNYDSNYGLLEIKDNNSKSKIKYYTADPEIVPKTFDFLKFDSFDYKFYLNSEEFAYIRKMVGLVDAKKVKFSLKNGEFKLVLFSDEKNPTFEKTFEIEASSELDVSTDSFSLVTPPDIFLFSPKGDYEIQIRKAGVFKFGYAHDTFDLNLFSAIEEND